MKKPPTGKDETAVDLGIEEVKKCENKNNVKTIDDYFREYCTNTSIHGFKYLAERRSLVERLLWACFILTSITTCLYLIHRVYTRYQQSPVIVTLATKESPIYTVPFPAVTVCPMAKARREIFNYTDVIHRKWDNVSIDETDELHGQYMSVVCGAHTGLFPKNETFTDDFFFKMDELKLRTEDIFHLCYLLDNEVTCSKGFVPVITDESICYTFNMFNWHDIYREDVRSYSKFNKTFRNVTWSIEDGYTQGIGAYPFRAFLSGSDNALDLTLTIPKEDIDYLCLDDTLGFSILLHPPYNYPLVKKQFLQVPLDQAVYVAVMPDMITTSQEVKKYRPQERECFFSDEKYLRYFKIYSPANCRLECLTNYTLKACECVQFYMPRDNHTKICGNAMLDCVVHSALELKYEELEHQVEVEKDFFCDCKPLCTELSYNVEISSAQWDYQEQFKAHKNEKLSRLLETHRFARVAVFFKSESFLTSQRNELYGTADLIANFGGLLGLFTGFSLLSFVEIIYFLTLRIWCNFNLYQRWNGR